LNSDCQSFSLILLASQKVGSESQILATQNILDKKELKASRNEEAKSTAICVENANRSSFLCPHVHLMDHLSFNLHRKDKKLLHFSLSYFCFVKLCS
jgi:hypothetical protein